MKDRLPEELMAMRAAKELAPGDYCNLGIGTPLNCALYVSEGVTIQSENGVLGFVPFFDKETIEQHIEEVDWDAADAGMRYLKYVPGMSYFDMLTSFAMIRSGRLVSILGGLQVSEKGDAAIHSMSEAEVAWKVGGSADLAWGAKRLIIVMTHRTRDGKPKIVHKLTMPVTVVNCVDLVITDIAVMKNTRNGLMLIEMAPGWNQDEIIRETEATLLVSPDVHDMEF